jgi:hypothetical protein
MGMIFIYFIQRHAAAGQPGDPVKANMGGFTQNTTESDAVYAVMKETDGDTTAPNSA